MSSKPSYHGRRRGPGYTIAGEFSRNGFKNDLKHTPGVLSMARSQHPDSEVTVELFGVEYSEPATTAD